MNTTLQSSDIKYYFLGDGGVHVFKTEDEAIVAQAALRLAGVEVGKIYSVRVVDTNFAPLGTTGSINTETEYGWS